MQKVDMLSGHRPSIYVCFVLSRILEFIVFERIVSDDQEVHFLKHLSLFEVRNSLW